MRRCLFGWREGNYNFRSKMSKIQADRLSDCLESSNKTKPADINHAIRNLKFLHFWKGKEYRIFLLYTGLVALKDQVSLEIYDHFLHLSMAVTILSCKQYLKYIDIAHKSLEIYIEKFIEIYGVDSISSNVHNLCHVIDDVQKFGHLPTISSYDFESVLGDIKRFMRSGNLPLSQISKRIIESTHVNESSKKIDLQNVLSNYIADKEHSLSFCRGVYEKVYINSDIMLSSDTKNRFFLTNSNEIVCFINATKVESKLYIYGTTVQNKHDFFKHPFASSNLNIYASEGRRDTNNTFSLNLTNEEPKLYEIEQFKCKLFCQIYQNKFVFTPLLHAFK